MGFEILNKLKKEAGLTTKELSDISNVPKGTLDKILNGQTTNPAYETVVALANALGCSIEVFSDNINKNSMLTSNEKKLIDKYNLLPQSEKDVIDKILDALVFKHLNEISNNKS